MLAELQNVCNLLPEFKFILLPVLKRLFSGMGSGFRQEFDSFGCKLQSKVHLTFAKYFFNIRQITLNLAFIDRNDGK